MSTYSLLVHEAHEHILRLLRACEDYPYHKPSHTIGVFDRSTYLALQEWVSGDELEDLQLAALFHDTGFTVQYEKNEYFGTQIATKWLEAKWHPKERIERICHIIMATVLFSKTHNILEEIIQDADLDNIGTEKEFYYSQDYLKELRTIGKIEISDCEYWQFVYRLLGRYEYHTRTARNERTEQKKKDIAHMEAFLTMIGCEIPRSTGIEGV